MVHLIQFFQFMLAVNTINQCSKKSPHRKVSDPDNMLPDGFLLLLGIII